MPMDAATPGTRRQVNGVTLHVVEAGPPDGPLVILLHGFPEFWWAWRRQIEPLAAAGFRVVAPDMRGYNLSDKPRGLAAYGLDVLAADVVALAEACGHASLRLVGHDWGGVVAWWTAVRHPERILRLVVMNAPHPSIWRRQARRHPTQALRSTYVAFFQLPWIPEAVLGAGNFAALRRAMTGSARTHAFLPGELDRYGEAWARPGALTAMLNYYRALRRQPEAGSGRIRPRTLVIWGVRDTALERHQAEAALELCDAGQVVYLDAATHWVHLEEPQAVMAAMRPFLQAG